MVYSVTPRVLHCGTSWVIWAGCELVTLGVCQHLDGLVIGGSLSRVGDCLRPRSIACEGSCAFPSGAPKETLVNCSCHWAMSLVGRFLQCPIVDEVRATHLSCRTTKCWLTQRGLACRQACEPREKNRVSFLWLNFSWWLVVIILWLFNSSTWRYNHLTHSITF